MATEIIMPKNGMDMTEGTLIKWLKNVGDKVEFDEAIMEIETDKVTMESESPATGVVLARYFDEGAVIPVLTVMGYIGEPGEKVPDAPGGAASAAPAAAAPAAAETPAAPAAAPCVCAPGETPAATPYAKALAQEKGVDLHTVAPTGPHGEIKGRDVESATAVKATPLAANVAADLGVSLGGVQGTGFGGKVTRDDVLSSQAPAAPAAAPAAPAAPAIVAAPGEELRRYPMSGMRKAIARGMTKSHTEIPTAQQNMEIDMTELLALRAQVNEGVAKEKKLTVNDFILRAVAMTTAEFPRFRMRIEENTYVETNLVNVGMAVGLDDGLVVPIIRSADRMDVFQLSAAAKDLAAKAKVGRLTMDEMSGGCISVSNLGMFGVQSSSPIINYPEASILGVCAALDRLALVDGNVVVRKIMTISHVFDHRIANGTEAAQFEQRLKFLLEHPALLLLPPQTV